MESTATEVLDDLRAREYSRLDRTGTVYLDYTAASLYAASQVEQHTALLLDRVFGNPHSTNPTSSAAAELIASTRRAVLRFFNASPDEWLVVFTANASQALKLVGESYPFQAGDRYLLTFDNHNSVNGIREFARAKGARCTYVPVILPDMFVDHDDLQRELRQTTGRGGHNLFAFPAQSNFSGVQHPMDLVGLAKRAGWDVILDAAAFAPTNRLDLSACRPDFVALSFYKMFGYPTGVGCLLMRHEAAARLHRPWFSGGTITVASVQGDKYYLAEGPSAFEDGTPDYLAIPAVEIGLQHLDRIGIEVIHERVRNLTSTLLARLHDLHHGNDRALARIYGPSTMERRGGTVSFNFYDAGGRAIDHRDVESRANAANISLRTGCFCNPGGGEIALGISGTELSSCFRQPGHQTRLTVDDFRLCIDGKSSGAVRVSFGIVSNPADVDRFIALAESFLER